jgi:hypothetical protein
MQNLTSKEILWIAAVVISWFVAVIVVSKINKHGVVKYDCRIAEISPDFPPDVRNECRKKNSGRI